MRYLIDGYNLLFKSSKRKLSLENKRRALIEFLNELAKELSLQITVVFDGSSEDRAYLKSHFDRLELVYTEKKQSADDYIYEEVAHFPNKKNVTVVTSDRGLEQRCKLHGIEVYSISSFFQLLQKKKGKKTRKSQAKNPFVESPAEMTRLLMLFEKRFIESLQDHLE